MENLIENKYDNSKDSKYDAYGVLKTKPWETIEKGDRVSYVDTILVGKGNKKKSKKVTLEGYWDGEKVEFDDRELTIVRTKRWLVNENVF